MAVAFDAKGTASQHNATAVTSFTFTLLTIGALNNTVLAVFVNFGANPGTVTARWDSAGANQLMTQVVTANATTNDAYSYIFGLIAPTTGNKTLSVSWTNLSDYCADAASFTGADQTAAASTFKNTATATGTTTIANQGISIAVTSPANDMAVAGWGSGPVGFDAESAGTNIFFDIVAVSGAAGRLAGAGTTTLTVSSGGGQGSWVAVGCDIAAVGTVATSVAWGFDEPQYRQIVRRATHPWPRPDDIAGFPFTAVVTPTRYYEEEPQRRDPRRFPKTAYPQVLTEEFLKNPTQFPAPAWVQDPDYFPRRLRAWRAHQEPLREEFLRNPTQTVYANWAFDEPRWRGTPRPLRQPGNSQPSDSDMPPTATAAVVPYSDDEARRPTRRSPWSPILRTDAIEGLPFTAATPANWPDAEQTTRAQRRSVQARAAQDEFLFNPTQISFAAWGFDEENHRLERRVLPRLTPQDDPIGLPQLVGVPWAYEEEAHRLERRTFHRLVQQDDPLGLVQLVGAAWGFEEEPQRAVPRRRAWRGYSEPLRQEEIGLPQLVGVPWSFEEEPQRRVSRRAAWRAFTLPLSEEFLKNPTQTAFAPWGFEEEAHRLKRAIFHRFISQEDPIGLTQLVGVPWGFEEEFHRLQHRIFHRLVQQDDPLGLVQLVGAAWGFEEEAHGLKYRPGWHAHPAPADNEGLPFTAVVTSTKWADIEQYISPRRWRARLARIAPDEFLQLSAQQAALVNWAFDEENHRMWRRPGWRASPVAEEFVGSPARPEAWGFEEDARRTARLIYRSRAQQDDPLGLVQLVGAAWGFETEGRRAARLSRNRLQQDDPLGVVQLVGTPWGFETEGRRPAKKWLPRGLLEEWAATAPAPVAWGWELDQRRGPLRSWLPRHQSDSEPGLFTAAERQAWADIEHGARAIRLALFRRTQLDDHLPQAVTPTATPWGWEARETRRLLRAIRSASGDAESLPFIATPGPWGDIEQNYRPLRPRFFRSRLDWYADNFFFLPFLGDPAAEYVLSLRGAGYAGLVDTSYYSALARGAAYVVTDPALRGELRAMPKIFEDLPPVAPTQRQTCAIDFGKFLPAGVFLTGTPTVRITVRSGGDPGPQSRLSAGPTVGTASPLVGGTGRANAAVIFQVSGCLDGNIYVIEAYCSRTDGDVAEAWTRLSCIAPS